MLDGTKGSGIILRDNGSAAAFVDDDNEVDQYEVMEADHDD